MAEDRGWMYSGYRNINDVSQEWMDKTNDFVKQAFARRTGPNGVLCPCSRCNNTRAQVKGTMVAHLCNYGFTQGYSLWIYHGESERNRTKVIRQHTEDGYATKIQDMSDDMHDTHVPPVDEEPDPTTKEFSDMLSVASKPLHSYTEVSQLDAITHLLAIKSQFSTSVACFDAFLGAFGSLLPAGHKLPPNLYEVKKLLGALKMPHEQIDVYPEHEDFDVMHSLIHATATYKAGKGKKHGRDMMSDGFIDSHISMSEDRASSGSVNDKHPQARLRPTIDAIMELKKGLAVERAARLRMKAIVQDLVNSTTPRSPVNSLSAQGTAGSIANPNAVDCPARTNIFSPIDDHADSNVKR